MNQESKHKQFKIGSYLQSEKFKPTKWSKYFWTLSGVIFITGLILLFTMGFNLGLDFTGGNIMDIDTGSQIEDATTYNNAKTVIEEVLQDNGITISRIQIVGSGEDAILEFQYQNVSGLSTEEMTIVNATIQTDLKTGLSTVLTGDVDSMVKAAETKSASASTDLLTNSFLALGLAVIAILIYVAIRFELISGLAAVITLFHDVLLMCALVLIFRIEINSAFIAAIITILGYSVNNTIVVFDRVRENMKKETLAGKSNTEIADLSIKQTLTRTFNTAFTTLIAVVLLAIIGVSAIREFIVPIIFGLLVGTYAAIFISAPLWAKIVTNSRFDKRKADMLKAKKIDKTQAIEATAEAIIDLN